MAEKGMDTTKKAGGGRFRRPVPFPRHPLTPLQSVMLAGEPPVDVLYRPISSHYSVC